MLPVRYTIGSPAPKRASVAELRERFRAGKLALLTHVRESRSTAPAASALLRRIDSMMARVVDSDDPVATAAGLPPALRAVAADTAALSDRITRRFFALLPALQSVGLEVA